MVREIYEERIVFGQDQFDTFARLSGDDNPIHVDRAFAARTEFGRTVAHGMMLFGFLTARATRWLNAPVVLRSQELMFPAPTFADVPHVLRLEVTEHTGRDVRIAGTLRTEDGTATVTGSGSFSTTPSGREPQAPAVPESEVDAYKGMTLGMRAGAQRAFRTDEIDEYCDLVGDASPRHRADHVVPAPLLGGTVSHLLGVELPGPGTNWLKQTYDLGPPVVAGQDVATTVEVVRFRPDKDLVNLSSTVLVGEATVATGYSLVHTQDLAAH